MIANILSKKKDLIVAELFIRGRTLSIFIVFIAQLYFALSKNIILNFTNQFNMKIPNKQELQQITFNHLSDIDFMNLSKKCFAKAYSFLVNNSALASDNPLHFRRNLLERI